MSTRVTRTLSFVIAFVATLGIAPTTRAEQGFGLVPDSEVTASLIADVDAVAPGQQITLGLHLEVLPDWHVYWQNPEGPGQPISVETWQAPAGAQIGEMLWPAPYKFDFFGQTQFGYSDQVTLLFEVQLPDDLEPGDEITFATLASWQVCKELCLRGDQQVSLTLPVQSEAGQASESATMINEARSNLPAKPEGWTISAKPGQNGGFVLVVEAPSDLPQSLEDAVYFFSDVQFVVDPSIKQQAMVQGNTLTLPLTLRARDDLDEPIDRDGPVEHLSGVLVAKDGFDRDGLFALAVDTPVRGEAPPPPPVETSALFIFIGSAFLGGLILNLMPCVFPVLSIKILGFVKQSGENPAVVRRHGYMFGLGVLISFWVLAGVLLALRGAAAAAGGGQTFSWGFQMQNPEFVLGMILLVFLIGLNLAGVFEIGVGMTAMAGKVSSGKDGYTKSFLSGVLATLIATPCTAPFMAGALGAALAMPTFQAMLIFTALGVGMAAPYVVLSCLPMLLKYLPKPGPWMESFKQAMAFPMFATAGWLVWVYIGLTGDGMIVRLLVGLTIIALAAWVYGRWSTPIRTARARWIARAAAAVFTAAGLVVVLTWEEDKWTQYSPQVIEQYREEGRPVIVDFTARWCISCQANKRSSLRTAESKKLYDQFNVALVEADYTREDPMIGKVLTEYGREGVPLYLVFPADGGEPEVLPNILTPQIVADAVKRAADTSDQQAAN
ncbi:MAG: protein-disulfide reductase DsbD domain-containing protein [Planctomycetota bacterium]